MATIEINVNGKQAESSLSRIRNQFTKTDKEINRTTKSTGLFSTQTSKLVGTLAIATASFLSFRSALNLGSSFTQTAAQFEQYETTLRSITGSSTQAKESMKWVEEFASNTPFNIDKVTESFVKMKAYGLDPLDGTLKTLGNTASAMGKPIIQAVEAMADAITGENERLKEFGIKAKKEGEQIAYQWADSSGKTRNIVIQNNKEMINSTLNAIFNEKYIGAMDAQSKTWNGMMSNMQDTWTIFKKDVMNEGLFVYLKGILGVLGDTFTEIFGSAKDGAKDFSVSIINGIKATISSIGVLSDTMTLFGSVFDFLKAGFWDMVSIFGTGINFIQESWNTLGNTMSVLWADVANGVKEVFTTMINFIINKINSLSAIINTGANSVGLDNVFERIENVSFTKTKAELTSLGEPISNVATALKYADEARQSFKDGLDSFASGDGQKKYAKALEDIDSKIKDIIDSDKASNSEKEKAQKILNDLIKTQDKLSTSASKAGKAQANQSEEVKKLHERYLELTGQTSLLEDLKIEEIVTQFKEAGYSAEKLLEIKQKLQEENADKFDSQFQLETPTIVAEVFNPYVELIESQKEYIKNIKEAGNNQYRVDKINSKHMSQQLKGYAGLTNGLKGFFKEGSKGYKALDAAQKTLQAFEFAWFIKKQVLDNTVFAKRLANISTDTAATVASESTKSTVLGVNAVLSQGQGDPYSAFARMAAMAAIVAGLGVAISGGGGGGISEAQMKDAEGITDFSDAVVNSIDELSEIEKEGLAYTQQMANSLDELVRLTNSAAAKIGSSSLDLTGSNYTDTTDKGFWNDKSIELVSSGITLHETSIHDLINGYISANAYTIEKITNSGFLGIGSSEKLKETDLGQIDTALGKDLAGAYEAGIDAQKYAAEVLGISGEQFMANAENWHTSLQRLNFEGKTEAEIAEMINGAISNDLDTLATTVMPHIEQFRIAGDTQMQTLIRLGAQHEAVSLQFELFGQKVGDFVASDTLIQAAGGLQKFQSAMATFTQEFFTEEEQREMKRKQLEISLAVHDIMLPAGKAQFKALLLETQQKMIAVKTNIETMKAGIRADIAANNYKMDADANYARSAISTANNINKASVLIGTSAHDMIEAAKGAGVKASQIDYTDAYKADVGLQALESELGRLEGIYGTLMSNMSAFASYYNGVESSSSSVASSATNAKNALEELAQSILDIKNSANTTLFEFNTKGLEAVSGRLQEAVNNVDYKSAGEEFNELVGRIKADSTTTYRDKVFAIAEANHKIQGIEQNDPNAKLIRAVEKLEAQQKATNNRLSAQERILRDIESNTENSSKVVGL